MEADLGYKGNPDALVEVKLNYNNKDQRQEEEWELAEEMTLIKDTFERQEMFMKKRNAAKTKQIVNMQETNRGMDRSQYIMYTEKLQRIAKDNLVEHCAEMNEDTKGSRKQLMEC